MADETAMRAVVDPLLRPGERAVRVARVTVSGGEDGSEGTQGTIRAEAKEVRRTYGTRSGLAVLYGLLGVLTLILVVITIVGLVVLERLSHRKQHSLPSGSIAGGMPAELRLDPKVDRSSALLVVTDQRILVTVAGETAPVPAPVLWECPRHVVRDAKAMWTDNLRRECKVTFSDESYISFLTPGSSAGELASVLGSR
ncbi:hypothetical protein [Streptomyces sp. SID3343]|uniref:hypothetical protein n=1 Tax=Streptomyces sp. SID3343 TaxID=2690260 RepID=UPI00136B4CDD|nr:hypothetical protein [Streptomyces sp. SID3343]MYW00199.1 hypothetical protein [Streptomyces sp. SID3343]